MNRKSYKAIITFRLTNVKTGEIEYELIKEYDLYYLSDRNFLHSKLDDFLQKAIKLSQVGSYSLEYIFSERPQVFELPLPF